MVGNCFWMVLTAFLVAANGGLLGSFLMLRRQSMVGDAIAHAVLPGMVVVFLLTGSLHRGYMFLGALMAALMAVLVISLLKEYQVASSGTAVGITFTSFFALGILLVARYTQKVDLDQKCVLFGKLEYVPFDLVEWCGIVVPRACVWLVSLLLLNGGVVWCGYPVLRMVSFDPAFGMVVGAPVVWWDYALLSLTALNTVVAVRVVGVVLVVAFMTIPPATAYLLTDCLSVMLWLMMGVGALMSLGGWVLASLFCTSMAGGVVVAGGGLFALVFCLGSLCSG